MHRVLSDRIQLPHGCVPETKSHQLHGCAWVLRLQQNPHWLPWDLNPSTIPAQKMVLCGL